jgi:8-oxo-dGTP pyrophosphatase MutT (NUDIX family)
MNRILQMFPDLLTAEMDKGLPGTEVQWQMASSDRLIRHLPRKPGRDAIPASVLIFLYPHEGKIMTLFMQRPDYDGVHGGQISFPGGKQQSSDINETETALREAQEETGADPSQIRVLGTLTPLFIPISNMLVTPVVGWAEYRPHFSHDKEEVVFLIEAELEAFFDPSIIRIKPWQVRSEIIEIKYFDYEGHTIWGATAMMLNELLTILRRGGFFLQG